MGAHMVEKAMVNYLTKLVLRGTKKLSEIDPQYHDKVAEQVQLSQENNKEEG